MKKVVIFGAGKIGANTALYIAEKRAANVHLIDVHPGIARGKAMDLDHAYPLRKYDIVISGDSDLSKCKGADVIVIAASQKASPDDSSESVLKANGQIVYSICKEIPKFAPNAVVIVVTNPLDSMTWLAKKTLGWPRKRVLGMAGVLDSTRLRFLIAQELKIHPSDTRAMVLGGSGNHVVPIPRYCSAGGVPITELLPYEKIQDLIEQTYGASEKIYSLLKDKGAHYAPADSAAEMVESIVRDRKRLLVASICLEGEYGISGVCLGVPIILGQKGIERIFELKLTLSEKKALDKSSNEIKRQLNILEKLVKK